VQLPKQRGEFERGHKVRVVAGALEGQLALFEGLKPRARVEVLLTLLGTQRSTGSKDTFRNVSLVSPAGACGEHPS
jgi:hypothetical protein